MKKPHKIIEIIMSCASVEVFSYNYFVVIKNEYFNTMKAKK